MAIGYVSLDEVNLSFALLLAEDIGIDVVRADLVDAWLADDWPALVVDWDSLSKDYRQQFLAKASPDCPIAMHGYSLSDDDVKAMEHRVRIVQYRLDVDLLQRLSNLCGHRPQSVGAVRV